jgi:hypothetical protein
MPKFIVSVLFGVAGVWLAACGPVPSPTVPRLAFLTPEASIQSSTSSKPVPQFVTATPAGSSATYGPLSDADCQALQKSVGQLLKLSFTLSEAPFTDAVTGEAGSGCMLTAQGSGDKFTERGVTEIQDAIKAILAGWTYSPDYQADGPVGESRGYVRDRARLIVIVEWLPGPDANCSPDQPISACLLNPEQKLYTITLQAAQK